MADLQLSKLYEEVRASTQEVDAALGLLEKQVDDFLVGVDVLKSVWVEAQRGAELMTKSEGTYSQTVHANLSSVHKLLDSVGGDIAQYHNERRRNAMLRELLEESRR